MLKLVELIVLPFLFDFTSLHDNHWAAGYFFHSSFYLMPSIAALKVGWEREFAFTFNVDNADSDTVFLFAFKYDRLCRNDAELFAIVGRCDSFVDRLAQYINKFHVPNLVAIEAQRTFLILAFVNGDHDVGQQIVFSVFEDWAPFNVTLTIALEACRACLYPRLARQRVRLVLPADYDLGQFDSLSFSVTVSSCPLA